MSLRCKKPQNDEHVFSRSKTFSWRGKENSRKSRSRRTRSLILTGSTSTTDSGYTSEKSDLDTLRGSRSRRTSVSSNASRASYMPNVCYHCQMLAQPAGARQVRTPSKRCVNTNKPCLRAEDSTVPLENIPTIDHSPYASLRQIFYDQDQNLRHSLKRETRAVEAPPNWNGKGASPVLTSWRPLPSPMPDNSEVKLRDKTNMVGSRRRKALHLSLYGTPSYADFYVPVPEEKPSLNREVKLRNSSKKLKIRRRVRSYDPAKFEKLLTPEDFDEWNQNVATCYHCKAGDYAAQCTCAVEGKSRRGAGGPRHDDHAHENILGGFARVPSVDHKQRKQQRHKGTIPWQKRQVASTTKRNKKVVKSDGRFLTAFYDKLRPTSARPTEHVTNPLMLERKISEDIGKAFYGGLFGKTYKQLYFLRSRLSPYSRQSEWICDGSFGCEY